MFRLLDLSENWSGSPPPGGFHSNFRMNLLSCQKNGQRASRAWALAKPAGQGIALAFSLLAALTGASQPARAVTLAPVGSTFLYNEDSIAAPLSSVPWADQVTTPFQGNVDFYIDLTTSINTLDLKVQIDSGPDPVFEFYNAPSNISAVELNEGVNIGSQITLELDPHGNNTNGDFSLDAEIVVPSGLLFLGDDPDVIDRVGFLFDGQIYEANPGYDTGNYWDILKKQMIPITSETGVQQQHSFGSFLHQSTSNGPDSTTAPYREHIKAPSLKVGAMAAEANSWLGTGGYLPYESFDPEISNWTQKGHNGNRFTSTGFVERIAEDAGVNGVEFGFIPNHREFIFIDTFFEDRQVEDAPWNCLENFPITVTCLAYISPRDPNDTEQLSLLSPAYLYYWLSVGQFIHPDTIWLDGWFESLDFELIGSNGSFLSYRHGELTKNIDNAFLYEHNNIVQLSIPDLMNESFTLKLWGMCDEGALAVIGNSATGMKIEGCKEGAPSRNREDPADPDDSTQKVPEPVTTFGLLTLTALIATLKRKRQPH